MFAETVPDTTNTASTTIGHDVTKSSTEADTTEPTYLSETTTEGASSGDGTVVRYNNPQNKNSG